MYVQFYIIIRKDIPICYTQSGCVHKVVFFILDIFTQIYIIVITIIITIYTCLQ